MLMNKYEAICAFHPNTGEEKMEALLARFEKKIKDNGGEYQNTEKMGLRRLSFTLRKNKGVKEAIFVMVNFSGNGDTVTALRDTFRITEEILRYLVSSAKEDVAAPVEEAIFPAEPLKEEQVG